MRYVDKEVFEGTRSFKIDYFLTFTFDTIKNSEMTIK